MIHALNKIVDWVENIMVVILMLVATVVAIVQVVARYVFNNSLYWSEELILYSLITMSFLAASMGVRYAAHISVEMLYAFAGPRLTRVLKYVATLLGFAFAATLVYYGGRLFINTSNMGQLSPAMQVPVAYIYLTIPVAGAFMLVRYLLIFQTLVAGKDYKPLATTMSAT
ncbi:MULTISPECIES: TRAP transporter small permease [Thauera]|jgi:C4-dicarboxylate transporter DctQ subunit|uniref:TRAP transporter small permease protein n=1 Tax=Thauera humireducens TaxID=1134435 RepID=A0A140IDE3_9RHOO|nr:MULTISPECIES: TRAP transporter small permease [Thauera]AMO35768.1 TRAP C4-dicarboxylate transporter [Thauera humireducens]ENO79699.1 tripartite ATP-independent periplasmic transporter DctQ component [Thauera sp. 63]CAH1747866.1 TRAP C4-dicarboxylate transporter [Thauera humireducens]